MFLVQLLAFSMAFYTMTAQQSHFAVRNERLRNTNSGGGWGGGEGGSFVSLKVNVGLCSV